MKKRILTIMVLICFIFSQTAVYASDTYNYKANQLLSEGKISMGKAMIRNASRCILEVFSPVPLDYEGLFPYLAEENLKKQSPSAGKLFGRLNKVLSASEEYVKAYQDHLNATDILRKELSAQILAVENYAADLMDFQYDIMISVSQRAESDRNTDREIPWATLAHADDLLRRNSKKLDDIVKTYDKETKKLHYKFGPGALASYNELRNRIVDYQKEMKFMQSEYPITVYIYLSNRYVTPESSSSTPVPQPQPPENKPVPKPTPPVITSGEKTGIVVNCNTYYLGLKKDLTGGSAYSVDAGSLVYIEGSDYKSSDGRLVYYVRTQSGNYGWISAQYLQVTISDPPPPPKPAPQPTPPVIKPDEKTGIIINCNTYYAGKNKNLTGGSAFSLNAGSKVYIEGSDYRDDGRLVYYVRTESGRYGWITAYYLQVD